MKTKKDKIEALIKAANGDIKVLHSNALPQIIVLMQDADGYYFDSVTKIKYTEAELIKLKVLLEESHPQNVLVVIRTA